ncbi:TerD family protein [Pedobacter sp. NJ-S-72]
MFIDLTKVSHQVEQIIICCTICKYPHDNKKDRRTLNLNFGQVNDCYIRIVDESSGNEIIRYDLKDKYTNEDAVEFGRLFRVDDSWEFEAMGRAHTGSLQTLVDMYS